MIQDARFFNQLLLKDAVIPDFLRGPLAFADSGQPCRLIGGRR